MADLGRSRTFYERLLDADVLAADDRFCALGIAGRQVLLLFSIAHAGAAVATPGGWIPAHDGTGRLHLAFSIPAESLVAWQERLARQGVAVESQVSWRRGGSSLYFRDPDGHLVELATPGVWPIY